METPEYSEKKDLPLPTKYTDAQAEALLIHFCIHAGISPRQTITVCQSLIAKAMDNTEGFEKPESSQLDLPLQEGE